MEIQQRSDNVKGPGTTFFFFRISMIRPEVTLIHFMIQCMEIQQRFPNIGTVKVTMRKILMRISEIIKSLFMIQSTEIYERLSNISGQVSP
jgi:hypothetical protein